jgi:hypothetical protein
MDATLDAFTALALVAEYSDHSSLCALSGCSSEARLACQDAVADAKVTTARLLRERLCTQCSWGAACCREGATRLSLDGQVAATELTTLLRYASVSGVREIRLRHCYVGKKGMLALATAAGRGVLDGLHTLNVSHDFVDDDGVEILADHGLRSGGLARLRILNLSNNAFSDRGLRALFTALTPLSAGAHVGGKPTAALGMLTCLRVAGAADSFSDGAMRALSVALVDGALPSLRQLVVPRGQEKHVPLRTACRARGVTLI